jgi:hypothetical protein
MDRAHLRVDEVERTFQVMGKHFLEMEPVAFSEGQYKTIVTVFTGLPHEQESEFIRSLHERLKPSFVSQGLMLGEFYPASIKTGLRNPGWHPLRSSPPLLVIRFMVRPDIAFLSDSQDFVQAYLSRFPLEGGTELRSFIERHRTRLTPENAAMLEEMLREFQKSQAASTDAGR